MCFSVDPPCDLSGGGPVSNCDVVDCTLVSVYIYIYIIIIRIIRTIMIIIKYIIMISNYNINEFVVIIMKIIMFYKSLMINL